MSITTFASRTPGSKTLWDLREIVTDVKWVTDMNYSAGTLTFKLVEVDEGYTPHNGDDIWFRWNGKKIFKGKVFNVKYSDDEVFDVTAYDSLRYFKNQDSLVFPASTLSQRFTTVAKLAGVKHKATKTAYKIPAEVCDSKSYFDMLKTSITRVRRATGNHYFLADNWGVSELRKYPYKKCNFILGDKSLLTGFSFEKSIDDAANVVRIIKENKKKKSRETSTAKTKGKKTKTTKSTTNDPKNTSYTKTTVAGDSVAIWGKLQYIEKAKDNANAAQMKQRAKDLLKAKNKQTYSLTLKALGNTDLVAGNSVPVQIKSLRQIGFGNKYALIKKATHNFTVDYNVELEMRVVM
ncbi:XkdQ/YqbQ family protein [Lentilactobacillus buchneri]|uniref:XkdQ/YqbQ family protein n=1 Tax=Lentilactobacillus buchneri TaxID=1581 RepID=UPI001291CF07|nr:late control protein D [Lentilactobacillus buchneri]MQM78806.1 late control protein D [Lentilactobacillus buchneri]MQM88860.1 late control protein D [Lentilactobacillus buchneri]MQN21009.1 late control protein D [Lentilactobacillus buchneri]